MMPVSLDVTDSATESKLAAVSSTRSFARTLAIARAPAYEVAESSPACSANRARTLTLAMAWPQLSAWSTSQIW